MRARAIQEVSPIGEHTEFSVRGADCERFPDPCRESRQSQNYTEVILGHALNEWMGIGQAAVRKSEKFYFAASRLSNSFRLN
jgi:hypothetical protein